LKTISNYLLLLAGFTLPLLFSNKAQLMSIESLRPTDSLTILKSKMDSISHEIDSIDEITNNTLENNNKILQNTKEILLRMDISLDSVINKNILEASRISDSSVIK